MRRGEQQQRRRPDEQQLHTERRVQAAVVGERAEHEGRDDDRDAADQLGERIRGVGTATGQGEGERQGEGVQVGDAEPRDEQAGDRGRRVP